MIIAIRLSVLALAVVLGAGCGGGGESSCARDADCDSGTVCLGDLSATPQDGVPLPLLCDPLRAAEPPGAFCERGDECDHGICLLAGGCAVPCRVDADCGEHRRCVQAFARTGPEALQPVRVCGVGVHAPAGVDVAQRELAGALTGRLSGDEVSFAEGLDPAANLVAVLHPSRPVQPLMTHLRTRDADGVVLFDLTGSELIRRNPPGFAGGLNTVLIPNGPDSVVTAAGYTGRIRSSATADAPADLTVTLLSRTTAGTRVDLDLFYVGVEGPSSPDAPLPDYVTEALARADQILAPAGVQVGDVRQHLVVGQLAEDLEIIENEGTMGQPQLPALDELFPLSAGTGRASVPVFLVRLVEGALGLAGGVPGPHGIHGTASSGVVISVGPIRLGVGAEEGIDLGRVVAHELGHFLGLFHTTEADGFSFEPLSDTPECPIEADADGDDVLTPSECDAYDRDNLMFWAASGETLSAQQTGVLTRGAVLR